MSLNYLHHIITQISKRLQFYKLLFRIQIMMRKKTDIVIGLTTFDNERLKISIPALGKLRQKFILIIHNNNPMTIVSRRQIRRLGYYGDLHIINANDNIGEMRARIEIINTARDIKPKWIIFCDDDDLIIDLDIPTVSDEHFIIIQNKAALKHKLTNLLRVMDDPMDFVIDDENVKLSRPNVGIIGNPIRATVLFGLTTTLQNITDEIDEINNKLGFYPPIKEMMWNFLNLYSRHINPKSVPIYMDKINYIKNDIDTTTMKYGMLSRPARNADENYKRVLDKYNLLLNIALNSTAAPRG